MPKLRRSFRRSGFETMQILAYGRTNRRGLWYSLGDLEHDQRHKIVLLVCRMAAGRWGAVFNNLGAIHRKADGASQAGFEMTFGQPPRFSSAAVKRDPFRMSRCSCRFCLSDL